MGAETYPPAADASSTGGEQKALVIGGEECPTFDDAQHSKIRAAYDVSEDFLAGFEWSKLKPGGGKGGNLMGFTSDGKYIVKEVDGTDHKMMRGIVTVYVEHVLAPEGSLMALMHAHVQRPSNKKRYIVMNNWLPKLENDPAAGTCSVYDLKGCADDKTMVSNGADVPAVHKRFSKPHMWCGHLAWSSERHTYYDGKKAARSVSFVVSPDARKWLMQCITRDCEFCKRHKLMDYSMILSTRTLPASEVASVAAYTGTSHRGQQPLICREGESVHIIYCGIIDFLQPWVFAKKVAKVIKSLEFNKATEPPPKYADRFVAHFDAKFVGNGEALEKAEVPDKI